MKIVQDKMVYLDRLGKDRNDMDEMKVDTLYTVRKPDEGCQSFVMRFLLLKPD